jgi:hypothetical protein
MHIYLPVKSAKASRGYIHASDINRETEQFWDVTV